MQPSPFCATAYVLSILSGRWKFQIVHCLLDGPMRFNQLQRELGQITHRSLSLQLKQMQESGLVERTDHGTIPPRVDYALTTRGQALRPVLKAMHVWAVDNAEERVDAADPATAP